MTETERHELQTIIQDAITTALEPIAARLDTMEARLDAMDSRIEAVERRMTAFEKRMDHKFSLLGRKIDDVDDRVSDLRRDIEQHFGMPPAEHAG